MKMRELILLTLSLVIALLLNILFTDPSVFGLFTTKASHAIVALVTLRVMLCYFDKVTNINFNEKVNSFDSLSLAIYFAGRFIGAAILFGCIFS